MKQDSIIRIYNYCTDCLDKLNHNQISALYRFFTMKFKDCDMLSKEMGRVACLHTLVWLRCKSKDEDSFDNMNIYSTLCEVWHFMLGMLMMQDEYNKYNKNYIPKVK